VRDRRDRREHSSAEGNTQIEGCWTPASGPFCSQKEGCSHERERWIESPLVAD